jgi:hypothetical protein
VIKRYIQFILESLSISDIESYFIDLSDSGFDIEIDDIWFENTFYPTSGNKISLVDYDRNNEYQLIFSGTHYRKGYKISIHSNISNSTGDITSDLIASISQIKGLGFDLFCVSSGVKISEEDIEEDIEDIKIENGQIIILNEELNEEKVDTLNLLFYGEEMKATDVDIAEYYSWVDWDEDKSKNIFVDIELSNVVSYFVKEKSNYYKILSGEEDLSEYYRNHDGYSPKPREVIDYLNMENITRMIKIFIKKCGGWDEFIEEYSYEIGDLKDMDQNGFLIYILDHKQSKKLSSIFDHAYEENEELIDKIRWEIGQCLSDSHADKNAQEVWESFYNMLDKHIGFTKLNKDVTRRNRKKSSDANKTWIENVEFLRITFDNTWIVDAKIDLMNESLESIFSNWVVEHVADYDKEIHPHLSDYGSPNEKELNFEISYIIEDHESLD